MTQTEPMSPTKRERKDLAIESSSPNTMKEGSVSLQYPMLSKSNYSAWSIKMEVYLKAQGVWDVIESKEATDLRRDMMALAAIYQGINEETLLQLGAKRTAKEAWNALKTMHLGADRVKEVRAQSLRWELEGMRMSNRESIDEFTGKISVIVNRLRALGEEVDEKYVVKKILRGVSPKFLQIASTIEEFGDLSNKTIEDVTGSLKAHEERLRGYDTREDDHVLLAKGDWRGHGREDRPHANPSRSPGRFRGGGRLPGRGSDRRFDQTGRESGQSQRQRFDIKKIRCYSCNELGHFASECKEKGSWKEEEAHLAENNQDEPMLMLVERCELILDDNDQAMLNKEVLQEE